MNRLLPGVGWNCSSILLLVTNGSSQLHKMYQRRCTAKNSWRWAERLPETCRVIIPIKLEFIASVGFIHKEHYSLSPLGWLQNSHGLDFTAHKITPVWYCKVVCFMSVFNNNNNNNNNNNSNDIKATVIPVIIGATGTISKSFRKYLSDITRKSRC